MRVVRHDAAHIEDHTVLVEAEAAQVVHLVECWWRILLAMPIIVGDATWRTAKACATCDIHVTRETKSKADASARGAQPGA